MLLKANTRKSYAQKEGMHGALPKVENWSKFLLSAEKWRVF